MFQLQTPESSPSILLLPFCDSDVILKELFNFSDQPKRKQALLKSNLSAIRLILIRQIKAVSPAYAGTAFIFSLFAGKSLWLKKLINDLVVMLLLLVDMLHHLTILPATCAIIFEQYERWLECLSFF